MGFSFCEAPSLVDDSAPLIYMWEIRDHQGNVIYRDVGRSMNGAKRPREDYQRNVKNLKNGLPYRPSDPEGFRGVHHELYLAEQEGFVIRLYLLQNVAVGEDINEAKRQACARYLSTPFAPVDLS
jgi:hypothetical protein